MVYIHGGLDQIMKKREIVDLYQSYNKLMDSTKSLPWLEQIYQQTKQKFQNSLRILNFKGVYQWQKFGLQIFLNWEGGPFFVFQNSLMSKSSKIASES